MSKTHHNNYNIRYSILSLGGTGGSYTMTGCDTGDQIRGAVFQRFSAGSVLTSGTATVVVASTNTVTLTTIGLSSTNGTCSIIWVDQDQTG